MPLFLAFGVGAVVSQLISSFFTKRGTSPLLSLGIGASLGALIAFQISKRGRT